MDFNARVLSKYDSLSKSHKKIARYASSPDTLFQLTHETVSSLCRKIGTSEATLVRFAYSLDYGGFSDMQRALQSELQLELQSDSQLEYKGMEGASGGKPDAPELRMLAEQLSVAELEKICDEIFSADIVQVIGYMDSYGLAAELLHSLDAIRRNVFSCRLISEWNGMLSRMNENSLCIAVSFAPHYKYTYECAVQLHNKNTKILLFTDSPFHPYAGIADYTFQLKLQRNQQFGHVNTAPAVQFTWLLIERIYEKYKAEIDSYRNSSDIRHEEYID